MNTAEQSFVPKRDFPEWIDSMVVKELRQAMQHRLFLIPFALLHLLMLLALAMEWRDLQEVHGGRFGSLAFWLILYLVLGLVMPLRGIEAIQEENHRSNLELLMMAGLSRWKIVRGKWLVHAGLVGLVVTSLLPYWIVRYFFGAFDFWENFIQLLGVIGSSLASSALIIGASGYKNYFARLTVCGIALLYIAWTSFVIVQVANFASQTIGTSLAPLMLLIGLLCGLGVFVILILLGLQLGRAHLKLYLSPWESSPKVTMLVTLIFLPLILGLGSVLTFGYGLVLVELALIIVIYRTDRSA